MASDLVAFLKARLDEDEAAAKETAASSGLMPVIFTEHSEVPRKLGERMLAEVTAKRAILELHTAGYPVTYPKPSGQPTCGVCHAGGFDWEPENWPCATVRAIAAVYSGHADYDPAWAPDQQYQAARNDS